MMMIQYFQFLFSRDAKIFAVHYFYIKSKIELRFSNWILVRNNSIFDCLFISLLIIISKEQEKN